MFFTSSSGRIEIQMTKAQAASCSHSGSCDADVLELSRNPKIAKQLAALSPDTLARELQDFGCWDDEELADHNQNLQRILWIAAGDITEGRN